MRVSSVVLAVALLAATVAAQGVAVTTGEYIVYGPNPNATNASDVVQWSVLSSTVAAPVGSFDWARMVYNMTSNVTGWDLVFVRATTSALDLNPVLTHQAAGFLEGYLTADRLAATYLNNNVTALPTKTDAWVTNHIEYITTLANEANPGASGPSMAFRAKLRSLLAFLSGLATGYSANAVQRNTVPGAPTLAFRDIFVLNFAEELWAAGKAANAPQMFEKQAANFWLESGDSEMAEMAQRFSRRMAALSASTDVAPWSVLPPRRCSALIKLTANDLFVSHDTWSSYEVMLRQYKTYAFETTVTMSGYAGIIHSVDDWYMTSNKLAVQETTNEFFNPDLFQYVVPTTVSEFLRVMIANYLAVNGSDWVAHFLTQNSGTYNNQFMVVDMKLFNPDGATVAAKLPDNLLWVVEQLPGPFSEFKDVTTVLRDQSYWASFNIPYFPGVYNKSGYLAEFQKYGTFFSYTKYARPEIFAREQVNVKDLGGMQDIMRFNDYTVDQFSLIPNCSGTPNGVCNPTYSAMLSIAARGDLNPLTGDYGPLVDYVSQRDHGAIDTKITSYTMMKDVTAFTGVVINGPTTSHGLAVFNWSTAPDNANFNGKRHILQANSFDFPFVAITVDHTPSAPPPAPTTTTPGTAPHQEEGLTTEQKIIIGCVCGGVVLIGGIAGFLIYRRQRIGKAEGRYNAIASETQPLV